MSNPKEDFWKQVGASGGTIDTNGMTSTEKQKADKAVADGRDGK